MKQQKNKNKNKNKKKGNPPFFYHINESDITDRIS